jgi:hypothetical protein
MSKTTKIKALSVMEPIIERRIEIKNGEAE